MQLENQLKIQSIKRNRKNYDGVVSKIWIRNPYIIYSENQMKVHLILLNELVKQKKIHLVNI